MTVKEKLTAQKTARIMRAARKKHSLTQQYISKTLGISQSCLSKMENGILIPSAPQWVEFCHITQIHSDAIMSGYIDLPRPIKLLNSNRIGSFKIPKKYSSYQGSKTRAMLPFVHYLKDCLGPQKTMSYFKHIKLDPDFFVDLDNQINLKFCLDLSSYLIEQKFLKPKDINKLIRPITSQENHGHLFNQYIIQVDPFARLEVLLKNAMFYECNFHYLIEQRSNSYLDISINAAEHLKEWNYNKDSCLGNFLCQYKQKYFEHFVNYNFENRNPKNQIKFILSELECHYKGFSKCIYRIQANR